MGAGRWPPTRLAVRVTRRFPDLSLRRRPLVPAVTATLLFVAGCGGGSTSDQDAAAQDSAAQDSAAQESAPSATTTPDTGPSPQPSSAPATDGIAITTAISDFGPMLFDLPGQAIYLFDKETTGRPDCYGECAAAWPPVLTTGNPRAVGGARPDLLGTVRRDDGSTQVTYAGHPLYYYAHEGPGQVLCHDVVEFGGRWLVVTPEGAPA